MRRCSFSALRIRTFFAAPRLEATKARGLRSFAAARSLAAGQHVQFVGDKNHVRRAAEVQLLCPYMVPGSLAMQHWRRV